MALVCKTLILLLLCSIRGSLGGCWFQLSCDNGNCYTFLQSCDGNDDCGDGTDERNCVTEDGTSTSTSTSTSIRTERSTVFGTFTESTRAVDVTLPNSSDPHNTVVIVKPDENLVIRCRALSKQSSDLTWYRAGSELPKKSSVINGILKIPHITCEDSGTYVCYSSNDTMYRSRFASVSVTVDGVRCTQDYTTTESPPARTTEGILKSYITRNLPWISFTSHHKCYTFCCKKKCEATDSPPAGSFNCSDGKLLCPDSVCDGTDDCHDGLDERNCVSSCPSNKYQCPGDGSCIPLEQVCDGEIDCADGSDESSCPEALPPKLIEYPKRNIEMDCVDPNSPTKGTHVLQLECTFVGKPLPVIRWKKYDGQVSSKCSQRSKSGHGVLVCPDFQQSDQGAYSCVAENPSGSSELQPKTVVKCKQMQCNKGFIVREEHGVETCLECFCSGKTNLCREIHSEPVTYNFRFPNLEMEMVVSEAGEFYLPNATNVNSINLKPVKYCSLPAEDLDISRFIASYGRNLYLPVLHKEKYNFMKNAPDVVIIGNDLILGYTFEKISQNASKISVRFWNDNWRHSENHPATRGDIMKVLSGLENLLVRCEYEEKKKLTPNEMSIITLESSIVTDKSTSVSYMEKCICPTGYSGLSCEVCAPGYQRDTFTGDCKIRTTGQPCKLGWTGAQCEDCDIKNLYYMHSKKKTCVKSTCDDRGSIGLFPDADDNCICKLGVTGENCDRCEKGFFSLEKKNSEGCKKCWCNNVTHDCRSSNWYRTTISSTISTWGGYNASNGGNFWLLPPEFSGNKLTSYGGFLRYTLKYQPNYAKQPKHLTVEILSANDSVLRYVDLNLDMSSIGTTKSWAIPVEEPFWRDSGNNIVSREKLLKVLTNVKAIYIESPYPLSSNTVNISSVELDVAEEFSNIADFESKDEIATKVEECSCPVGYTGLSCETCSRGYYRVMNGLDKFSCVLCNCDLSYCDPLRGCEECEKGFYNNITEDSAPPVCLKCPCNGNEEFCQKDDNDLVMCICKTGYYGVQCEYEERTGTFITMSLTPSQIVKKKIGALLVFNCSYQSEEDLRIEFQRHYTSSSAPAAGLFKIEHYGVNSVLEMTLEQDLDSVECIARNIDNDIVGRITAKVFGTVTNGVKPQIKNCYDEPRHVKENEDLYLNCDATGTPEPELIWFKMEFGSPEMIESFDGVYSAQSAGLNLNGTVYTCVARNIYGEDKCSVRVIVEKRCILSIQPSNLIVEEGESAQFNCTSTSGNPVVWSRPGGSLRMGVDNMDGKLIIPNARLTDEGIYVCSSMGPDGMAFKEATLSVQMKMFPPKAAIQNRDIVSSSGKLIEIECTVTGQPQPKVVWSKLGSLFIPKDTIVEDEDMGSRFIILNATREHSGVYECRAESILGNSSSRIMISVVDLPEIRIEPDEVFVKVGDSISIDCEVLKGEPLLSLIWSYDNDDIIQTGDTRISLVNVNYDNTGFYHCTARNEVGEVSKSVRVNIGESPVVTLEPKGVVDVVTGDFFDVKCTVTGYPPPTRRWLKFLTDNGASGRFKHEVLEVINDNSVVISVKITEDLSRITCEARNALGVVNKSVLFRVKPTGVEYTGEVKRVPIGSRIVLDFSKLGKKIKCERLNSSMVGDECPVWNGLEIPQVQVQHNGTYVCTNEAGDIMSHSVWVIGFVNKFTKIGKSFIRVPITLKSSKEFHVEVTFKPEKSTGLILLKKEHHAFIMYLHKGKVVVVLRSPHNTLRLTSKENVKLDAWQTAVFNLDKNARLQLYDEEGQIMDEVWTEKIFPMTWKSNVEDALYIGGARSWGRQLHPLRSGDIPFQGCISRLIVDDHEYSITEEGKYSRNVSLCKICASDPNLCGANGVCLDAPTHYGYICVCGNDGKCPQNCRGHGCMNKRDMCNVLKPCGQLENRCVSSPNSLKCHCAKGYSGITCEDLEAYEFSLKGNGYLRLPYNYLSRDSYLLPEVISITFTTDSNPQGELLYQGDSQNYLEIQLQDRWIIYEYYNQLNSLLLRGMLGPEDNHKVVITRQNNTATMEIDGAIVTGSTAFSTNRVDGDIYIGGLPQPSYRQGYNGCISSVIFGNEGKPVNILAKGIERRNIALSCKNANRYREFFDIISEVSDSSTSLSYS